MRCKNGNINKLEGVLVNKKKIKNKFQNPPKSKKTINPYSSIVGEKGIYTYTKRRKPKRIGKECIYFSPNKLTCKLSQQFCKDAEECDHFVYCEEKSTLCPTYTNIKHKKENIDDVGITAIVLSDNRKCTGRNHTIQDVQAKLRISLYSTSKVIIYDIPSAYCNQCDLYFVLKEDFKKAKEKGIILCPVIDRTQKYLLKHKSKIQSESESRIHQLGYNVQKGNGISIEQRHKILANIIENTNITKHEIISCIERPMMQHLNQVNYADAIKAWKADLEFINNYQFGDMPEVIIDKIIIGKR